MDSPQYGKTREVFTMLPVSFKPYYKWIVLNTSIKI